MSGIAEGTIRAAASCGGKTLLTSDGLGWTSLLVRIREFSALMDPFEIGAIPDPRIVLLLNSASIQQFSQGRWRRTHYGKGMGFTLPPGSRRRLRWNLKNQKKLTTMYLSLSQDMINSVASAVPENTRELPSARRRSK